MNTTRDPLLQDALDALGLSSAVLVSAETRATDTRVWQVRHDGRLLAIRVLRNEQARVMEIERQSMQLARAAGVPVPEIINTACIDGQRPAMAIEWVSGETVGDVLLKHPRLVWRLGRQAGSILASIHAISAPSSLTENTN